MQNYEIEIFDGLTQKRIGFITKAIDASVTRGVNTLWTMDFIVAVTEPCLDMLEFPNIVQLTNPVRTFGKYRIKSKRFTSTESGEERWTISCEHVLAVLLNDQLEGYTQIGNLGVYTADVINHALSKQKKQNWILKRCDFRHQFEYGWQSESLLAAMWSIANPFSTPYLWRWNTSVYPWELSLEAFDPDGPTECEIWRGTNMQSLDYITDWTRIVTNLEVLGYGEGDNQLNVAKLNGGSRFLTASQDAIDKYGIITATAIDRRFEVQQSLLEWGQAMLQELQKPREEIKVGAINRYTNTKNELDNFEPGKRVRINYDLVNLDEFTTITKVTTPNALTEHWKESIEIATAPTNIAQSVAEAQDRARIEASYAQGNTNIYVQTLYDNADASNPAVIDLWIPAETKRLNSIQAVFRLDNFRAFSRTLTSEAATATTTQSNPIQTSLSNGTQTSESSPYLSTLSGGGNYSTTSYYQQPGNTSGSSSMNTTLPITDYGGLPYEFETAAASGSGSHRHRYYLSPVDLDHAHNMQHWHITPSASHSHGVDVPAHAHSIGSHSHRIPGHTHQIPSHTHAFTIPGHSHAIVYGIYKGPKATAATIYVDGRAVPLVDGATIDLAPYLSKNGGGEVETGKYHKIEIRPNGLTRVSCTVTTMLFIQSRISTAA